MCIRDRFNPTKKLLKINASYAFGTGYHSTTRHCIETMYECSKSKKFQNILDYGSGSGILGIAAKKLMPYSKITLIDVDNLAVKMSKFNLKKNNIIFPIAGVTRAIGLAYLAPNFLFVYSPVSLVLLYRHPVCRYLVTPTLGRKLHEN